MNKPKNQGQRAMSSLLPWQQQVEFFDTSDIFFISEFIKIGNFMLLFYRATCLKSNNWINLDVRQQLAFSVETMRRNSLTVFSFK